MTNWPDASATARSRRSLPRSNSTTAPGAALPAITASPASSTRATSKEGTDGSVAGILGGKASSAARAATLASVVASADGLSLLTSGAGCEGLLGFVWLVGLGAA